MTQQQLLKKLEQFGFTATQARLYVAGLQLGRALMKPLAQQAKVSRSTAYYLMRELKRRGFFTVRKAGKRTYYEAALPQRLLVMTQERERLIRGILPSLNVLQR